MFIQYNDLIDWLSNDLGSGAAGKFERLDHPLVPWEKRCHALAGVLDAPKIICVEENPRGVEALGADDIAKLTYYEQWAVCFANLLFAKRLITPDELARKMAEVSGRLGSSASSR